MPPLIHDDFLLRSHTSRELYHEHAAGLPILDYHSHVATADLAVNRSFANLTEVWISPDQYKHRAMRALGVAETFITGEADPYQKFMTWAGCLPQTVGHPLYHWTALELKRFFGIDEPLEPRSARAIWEACNAQLSAPSHRARALLRHAPVACINSSDKLLDDLDSHHFLAGAWTECRVLPSVRPDELLAVESPDFSSWVAALGRSTGRTIADLDTLHAAVEARLDAFAAAGCVLSDHGLDVFDYETVSESVCAALFKRRLNGDLLTRTEAAHLRSGLLFALGRSYARRNWTMQLHLGAQRRTSSRLRTIAGPAGGYASIGNATSIPRLCQFLDDLEAAAALPRTILFTLNPADNAALATLTGSFTAEGCPGKIQFGPAWWFNDHALGIRQHLDVLSHYGLLSTFVGMTTDSRSLLSLTRHEYFRRVACDYIGEQVEHNGWPADRALLAGLVRRICYGNAREYLFPSLPA